MSNTNADRRAKIDHMLRPEDLSELWEILSALDSFKLKPNDAKPRFDAIAAKYGEHGQDLLQQVKDRWKADGYTWRRYTVDSMIDLSRQREDTSQYLLGKGWLERGGGGFIVAASGIGKTVSIVQAGFKWSVGKPEFGIQPFNGKPLKILLVQAENPRNKMIRTSQMWLHLGFTGDEAKLCAENFKVISCNDITNNHFVDMLAGYCHDNPTDLILIDPFNSYMSGSPSDEEKVKKFLRAELNPMLTASNVGCLIVHHTPKTNNTDTSGYNSVDFRYRMSGSSELTNWARCIMVIEATRADRVFQYQISKAYDESGWTKSREYYAHTKTNGAMYWSPATDAQIRQATGAGLKSDDLIKFLTPKPERLFIICQKAKPDLWTEDQVKQALRELSEAPAIDFGQDPWVQKVWKVAIRTPGKNPVDGWQSTPPTEDLPSMVFGHIPADEGIKLADLQKAAYEKSGITSKEVVTGVESLSESDRIRKYTGEGSDHASRYIIRADYEIQWKAQHPKSSPVA